MARELHAPVPCLSSQAYPVRPLTPRRQLFVREYLCDLNATQAALRAGYAPKSASEQSFDLLRNPQIQAAVEAERIRRNQRLELKADDILGQVNRMLMFDPRLLVDEMGHPIPLQDLPTELAMAIQGVDISQAPDGTTTFRYRFADRNSAAEKLMKHLGLYEKDNRQVGDGLVSLMNAVHGDGSRLPTKE